MPLRASIEVPAEGAAIHHRTLVVLERGARATFAEDYSSTVPGYVNTVVELVIGDGARLEYVTTQKHHAETRQFGTHRATIGRDGEVDWVVLGLGGTRAKSRIESYLADQGANAKVTGAYFLTGTRARRLRHDAGARGAQHDVRPVLQGRAGRPRAGRLAGRDPGRQGCAEDRRLPGEPQPAAVARGPCRLDPGARDRGQRRALHARRHDRPDRPAAAVLPDEPRAQPARRPSG